jgi:hypothetical protein
MNGKPNGQISSVDLRTSGSIRLNWKHLSCNIKPFTALAFIFLGVMLTVFCIHGRCMAHQIPKTQKDQLTMLPNLLKAGTPRREVFHNRI